MAQNSHLTPRIHYAQVTEGAGDGASTLALKHMGWVNWSPQTESLQWLHKMVAMSPQKLKKKEVCIPP